MFREMYSSKMSEEKGGPTSPRISFSNEFVESNPVGFLRPTREAPISTEFEFSVSSSSVQLCADELFSKGRILPRSLPLPPPHPTPSPTLRRDELISVQSGNGDGPTLKPPLNLKGRWKGFLGLRRSHIPSKKPHSSAQKLETTREGGTS